MESTSGFGARNDAELKGNRLVALALESHRKGK